MTFYIITALSAFMMSLIGTRLAIQGWRMRPQPVDVARLRSGEAAAMPGGGMVVVFTLVICLLVANISYGVVLGLLLLAAISLLGSLIAIPFIIQLLVQVMAVTVPLSMSNVALFDGILPGWLDKSAMAVLWIGCINMFRSLDRAEGIASSQMIAIGGGIAFLIAMTGSLSHVLFIDGLVIATAGCGFLWWNWPPAKALMGEAGSVPIGYVLGYALLLMALSGYIYAALILPAYGVCECLLTWLRKDRLHYYEKAVLNGRWPAAVVRYVIGIHILLAFLALRSALDPGIAWVHLLLAYAISFLLLSLFTRKHV